MPQLVPFYLDYSNLFKILYNSSPSPILICVLVLVIILFCTEQGSSTNQAHKQDHIVKVPGPTQTNPPVANITYVN